MISLALCLALAVQDAPTHAALHPADADLFVEIPDVAQLFASYPEAPLVQLLGDDELSQAIGELMGTGALDLETELTSAMAMMLPPQEMQLVQSVRALSFSVRVAPQAQAMSPPPSFCFVVDFQDATAAQAAHSALETNVLGAQPHTSSAIAGAKSFHSPALPGLPMWSAVIGAKLVIGGGTILPDDVSTRLQGVNAGLAGKTAFIEAAKPFGSLDGPVVVQGYTSRSPLAILADSGMVDQRLGDMSSLGLPFAGGGDLFGGERRWRMQLTESRFVTEMTSIDAAPTSAPQMLGGVDVEEDWLASVPGDAMFVYASAFDGAVLHNFARPYLRSSAMGVEVEEVITRLETGLGFGLDQLLSRMGPGMVMYSEALRGPAIPETYIWIDLDDPAAFQTESASLVESLTANFPVLELKTRDYRVRNRELDERRTFAITTLTLPPELIQGASMMAMAIPSPAFTVAGDKLLVSLSSMHLKRELKRLYAGNADESAKPLLEAQGIALPENARSLIVMDWAGLLNGIFSLVRTFAPLAGDQLPFDIQALPDPEVITQYFGPTIHYSKALENGTYRRHEASFGPETWLGAAAAAGMAFGLQGLGSLAPASAAPVTAPQPVPRPVDDGQRFATDIALQTLRMGVAIYKLETEAYPSTLDLLVQGSDSFPEGMIDQDTVPHDGWGRPFRYEVAEDASSYRLWSFGANGVDENGEGDDVTGL